MKHHCHALGCGNPCPPRYLMCPSCWRQVPSDLQREVYRTVSLRDKRSVDETWAPWWRAQARAIAHVAHLREPNELARDRYLKKEMAFADKLEKKAARETLGEAE